MRKGLIVIVLVLFATMVALAVEEEVNLEGGHLQLIGSLDKSGKLNIDMLVAQADPGMMTLHSVQIYSEPSHRLLCAVVEPSMVDELKNLSSMKQGAVAERLIEGTIGTVFSIAAPPKEDTRLVINYVITNKNGYEVSYIVRDIYLPGGFSRFGFETGPCLAGAAGTWTTTCRCEDIKCGTVTCNTRYLTMCCGTCRCLCGNVQCPQ